MLDVEVSPEVGSKEILEDSDDELVVKTRISDSNDASNEESDTEAMGISSPPLPFLAFSSLLIVIYTFVFGVFPSLPCMSPYHAITEALEVPKVVDVSIVPTLIGPDKFTLQFLSSFLRPFFFFLLPVLIIFIPPFSFA